MGFLKFNFRSAALSMDAEVAVNFPTDRFNYYPPEAPRHHIVPGAKPKPQIKPPRMPTRWIGKPPLKYSFSVIILSHKHIT